MIELVVFDLAGTTVHDGNSVGSTFQAALAARGVDADPAAIAAVMGLPKPEAIRILLKQFGQPRGLPDTAENIDTIHADFTRRMCDYYAASPDVREVPGASAVFSELRHSGIKVAVNTGFSRPIVDVLLRRLGWHAPEVIDASVTSDEVPRGRPYPDMIRHLMARCGVSDARRVAKVGDTPVDLEEGTNAGCELVIGVTTGAATADRLRQFPHTHIVDSVTAVPALLALPPRDSGTAESR
jgi:phosphonatase-like hydrolase